MNKREIKGYFREMFLFDIKRERIIYSYLCREKLSKKQRKLLTDETRFGSYQSWKAYIVSRYEVYTKESLLEFSRAINQFLRESKQFDEYHRNVVIAYMSAVFCALIPYFTTEAQNSIVLFLVMTIVVPIFIFALVVTAYNSLGGRDTDFYEDIKDIIDQMIEEKA